MAARAIKKTSISFGLVSVPVSVFKATDEHGGYRFHQFHVHEDKAPARINQVRRCADCGEEVGYGDLARGAEVEGKVVIVTQDDLDSVQRLAVHGITVEQFVDADSVPVALLRDVYHIARTDAAAVQGYSLLRQVMADSGRVAVVRFALRADSQHLGVLRADGDVLTLTAMVWPEDMREPVFKLLAQPVELPAQILAAATMLVDSMTGEFDLGSYQDSYTVAIAERVAAKAAGVEMVVAAPDPEVEVGDLLAKLTASIAAKGGAVRKRATGKRSTNKCVKSAA